MEAKLFPCFSLSEPYILGNSLIKLLLFQARLEVSQRKCHLCWGACQAAVEIQCFLGWSRAQGICSVTHWQSAMNLLLMAWAFDGWSTDFTLLHRTVVCSHSTSCCGTRHNPPELPGDGDALQPWTANIPVLWSVGWAGLGGVYSQRVLLELPPPSQDSIYIHAVTEVSWMLLLKVSPWNSPFCADGQGEHSSPSPVLTTLQPPVPSPAAFPAQPFLSIPMCSATQITHFSSCWAGPGLCLWAGQGWWRQHHPCLQGIWCCLWLVKPRWDFSCPPTSFEKRSPKLSLSPAHIEGNLGEELRQADLSPEGFKDVPGPYSLLSTAQWCSMWSSPSPPLSSNFQPCKQVHLPGCMETEKWALWPAGRYDSLIDLHHTTEVHQHLLCPISL